ncbi:MAG TPA: D-aminoacyl-tRNA deacylase [bacterium]|nr:D-aminoacyl-tRNA deacylase [bacterium]
MRAVIQRVKRAKAKNVSTGEEREIGEGLAVLIGIKKGDTSDKAGWLADKVLNLRIFPDEKGRFDRSLKDTGGELLLVSQFTLYGDCLKGRRPDFSEAEAPEKAELIYRACSGAFKKTGVSFKEGWFAASMELDIVNWGPVTLILDV